jgi:hypothetical protein
MKATLHNNSEMPKRGHSVLLITGDGRTLHEEMEKFFSWEIYHDAGCIGRSVKEYPFSVNHWFNADGPGSEWWAKNLPERAKGALCHTMGNIDGFDIDWDMEQPDYHYAEITGEHTVRNHGSSALFAALAAIAMGYKKIVLAGCPLDTEGHWYWPQKRETLGPIWLGLDYMAWLDFAQELDSYKVRSMSGYTAKIIGKASKEWITNL